MILISSFAIYGARVGSWSYMERILSAFRAARALLTLELRVSELVNTLVGSDASSRRSSLTAKILRAVAVYDESSLLEHIDSFTRQPLKYAFALIEALEDEQEFSPQDRDLVDHLCAISANAYPSQKMFMDWIKTLANLVDRDKGDSLRQGLKHIGLYDAPEIESVMQQFASLDEQRNCNDKNEVKMIWVNSAEKILIDFLSAEIEISDVGLIGDAALSSVALFELSERVLSQSDQSGPERSPLTGFGLELGEDLRKINSELTNAIATVHLVKNPDTYLDRYLPVALLPLICLDLASFASFWSYAQSTEDGYGYGNAADATYDPLVRIDFHSLLSLFVSIITMLTEIPRNRLLQLTSNHVMLLLYQLSALHPAQGRNAAAVVQAIEEHRDILSGLLRSVDVFIGSIKLDALEKDTFNEYSMRKFDSVRTAMKISQHLYTYLSCLVNDFLGTIYKLSLSSIPSRISAIGAFSSSPDSATAAVIAQTKTAIPIARNRNPVIEAVRSCSPETLKAVLNCNDASLWIEQALKSANSLTANKDNYIILYGHKFEVLYGAGSGAGAGSNSVSAFSKQSLPLQDSSNASRAVPRPTGENSVTAHPLYDAERDQENNNDEGTDCNRDSNRYVDGFICTALGSVGNPDMIEVLLSLPESYYSGRGPGISGSVYSGDEEKRMRRQKQLLREQVVYLFDIIIIPY